MKRICLLALLCLVLTSCGKSPRDYTLEEWERLDKSERAEMLKELGEEDSRLLMMGALQIGLSGDTAGVKAMTVGRVIEWGRDAKERDSLAGENPMRH